MYALAIGGADYNLTGPGSDAFLWRTLISDAYPQDFGEGGWSLSPLDPLAFTGGIWKQGTMDGATIGLVEDVVLVDGTPTNTILGIATGQVLGQYFENVEDFQDPSHIAADADALFVADAFMTTIPVVTTSYGSYYRVRSEFENFGQLPTNGGNIIVDGIVGSEIHYSGVEGFGVWESYMHGTGLDSDEWYVRLIDEHPTSVHWVEAFGDRHTTVNEISGQAPGAWVELGSTGVIGGEIKGTFNPNNWQAVALGAYLETSQFLGMQATTEGQAQLQQLNIPSVEIGRTSLSYENLTAETLQSVNMNDVVFFAYSTGGDPRVFASNDVNGTFAAPPLPGHSVSLTGAHGVNADFTINTFGISPETPWDASVRGDGTYTGTGGMTTTQPIWMEGGAAGTVGTSNTFTGTAAGVAGVGANPHAPAP